MPTSYMALSEADARWLLSRVKSGVLVDSNSVRLEAELSVYLERFESDRFQREAAIRSHAEYEFHEDGELEIDDEAVVSEGDDNGAYIMAWKWVPFAGTKFDKEKEQ